MKLNFQTRIALHYLLATSVVSLLVFAFIYFIVRTSVYDSLDRSLSFEANKHLVEIAVEKDTVYFTHKKEWEEIEHKEVQINPVFLQLMGPDGQVMDKSPNLKEDELEMQENVPLDHHYDTRLKNRPLRQVQIGIFVNGEIHGYIVAAVPLEASLLVLTNLMKTLLVLFPLSIIGLFLISRYLAGKSISPISTIIATTNSITKSNLSNRVPLPEHRDELYDLSASINGLLDRIEAALEREKQFTSDASHELRTPLAALRGTLEILVRKQRNVEDYEEKIKYSLSEVDRMSDIVEQLLFLARNDQREEAKRQHLAPIAVLMDEALSSVQKVISRKQIKVILEADESGDHMLPYYYGKVILDNILSNAVKYGHENSVLTIKLQYVDGKVHCYVKDQGIGIKKEDLNRIFNPFFRSDALEHPGIKGSGLGLSIVKKATQAIGAEISIQSEQGAGTVVHLVF